MEINLTGPYQILYMTCRRPRMVWHLLTRDPRVLWAILRGHAISWFGPAGRCGFTARDGT
jgi:hypothetical protein